MHHTPSAPGLALATDAILTWPHRYGSPTTCLARLRGRRDQHTPERLQMTVVLSELSGQPRGHYVLSDLAGAATTAVRQLVPVSVDPAAITWLVHQGPFSTVDPSGPETLTRVTLEWRTDHYQPARWDQTELLTTAEAEALHAGLHLGPVDHVLAALPWDIDPPLPRRRSAETRTPP